MEKCCAFLQSATRDCAQESKEHTCTKQAKDKPCEGRCARTFFTKKANYSEERGEQSQERTCTATDEERRSCQLGPLLSDTRSCAQADTKDQRGGGNAKPKTGVTDGVGSFWDR
jgi:hypothetical protein